MASEYSPYLFLSVFLLAAVLFPLIPIALSKLWAISFSPQKPGKQKTATYECGLESKGDAWAQFRPEYYIYGLLFLIFDVEVLFLLPFAVAFLELPFGAVLAMLVFLFLMAEGLVWAWRKGILNWLS